MNRFPTRISNSYLSGVIRETPSLGPINGILFHFYKSHRSPSSVSTCSSVDASVGSKSAKKWAKITKVFNKLYHEDIDQLRDMSDLWEKRRAPESILYSAENLKNGEEPTGMRDQRLSTLAGYIKVFGDSLQTLIGRLAPT